MTHRHYTRFAAVIAGLTLALAAAAQRRPFSHKYHLTQVAACEQCHQGVTESTKATDNVLPHESACATCHDEVKIAEPRPRKVSFFNHQLHLKLGNPAPLISSAIDKGLYLSPPGNRKQLLSSNNACSSCHQGIEQSETPNGKNHPAMADCLVCHNKIDPPDSCAKCHAKGFDLTPENHGPRWIDEHSKASANIDKTGCAVCHGKKFTCRGCH